jgi:hypothetical protein
MLGHNYFEWCPPFVSMIFGAMSRLLWIEELRFCGDDCRLFAFHHRLTCLAIAAFLIETSNIRRLRVFNQNCIHPNTFALPLSVKKQRFRCHLNCQMSFAKKKKPDEGEIWRPFNFFMHTEPRINLRNQSMGSHHLNDWTPLPDAISLSKRTYAQEIEVFLTDHKMKTFQGATFPVRQIRLFEVQRSPTKISDLGSLLKRTPPLTNHNHSHSHSKAMSFYRHILNGVEKEAFLTKKNRWITLLRLWEWQADLKIAMRQRWHKGSWWFLSILFLSIITHFHQGLNSDLLMNCLWIDLSILIQRSFPLKMWSIRRYPQFTWNETSQSLWFTGYWLSEARNTIQGME